MGREGGRGSDSRGRRRPKEHGSRARGISDVYSGGGRPEGLERADGLGDSRRTEGPEIEQGAKCRFGLEPENELEARRSSREDDGRVQGL